MATDIDILRPRISTKTKRVKAGFAWQHMAFQGAIPGPQYCNATCPQCQQVQLSGACVLAAGHAGQHQCQRSHQWTIPGPQ